MEAYVITLRGNEYSERVAGRCIESGYDAGVQVKTFDAIAADDAIDVMLGYRLPWTWGRGHKDLDHHSYGGDKHARIGCAMSHYELWRRCAETGPMLILEHDAVFINPFTKFDFNSICMINDPLGATPRGDWWSEQMEKRGAGVWPKTRVFSGRRPDGLAGNSAYVIKPHAAERLIDLYHEHGVWPNDATMCVQFMPDMQEHYPFITRVEPEMSTI